MKNKITAALLLAIIALAISSCASSRRSGCPMNQQENYRYRG